MTPYEVYYIASSMLGRRYLDGEAIVSQDPKWSYWYARDIIRGCWPEGEAAIARDALYAFDYAVNILKGRFSLGERLILNSEYAENYCGWFGIKSELNWREVGF